MPQKEKFNKKVKKTVFSCLVFNIIIIFIILSVFIYPKDVFGKATNFAAIRTEDDLNWFQSLTNWIKTDAWNQAQKMYKEARAAAFKASLGYFLNQLAYDTATYLATGDHGQKPMFITESWGDYLRHTADNAAGLFIDELGKEGFAGTKFNLCEPDFAVQFKIVIGLQKGFKPPKPTCTFTEMKKNWQRELKDPNFLPRFQQMFNPWENDLGQALTLQTHLGSEVDRKLRDAELDLMANQGFKSVKEAISGFIKTPSDFVRELGRKTLADGTKKESVYTGTLADAIDTFINTLIGKLIEKWYNEGLVTDFPEYEEWSYDYGDPGGLGSYEAQKSTGGIAEAKARFRTLIEPEFATRGDYNILGELTTCPDPTKAGPTNCVITEDFRQAISENMTVGEAMKEGYLNRAGIFGFAAPEGLEPDYYDEGYPYRSMQILRKFRIIPAGWEIAAQFIKDFAPETFNLEDMVACFDANDEYASWGGDSWCRGLVDPNWVLKAPLNYCKRAGPGPEIISESVAGSGSDSYLTVTRDDNYCADEQACIQENEDGSCRLYGYCTEERRKWQFNAKNCDPLYNTCQTFRDSAGQKTSYLENTMDYSNCGADNAGCLAYCTLYDYGFDTYDCLLDDNDVNADLINDRLYLDGETEECKADVEGCHEFIRTKAGLGANVVLNSSFEESDTLLDPWVANGNFGGSATITSSESYDGNNSIEIILDPLAPPAAFYGVVQSIYDITPFELITVSFFVKTDIDTIVPAPPATGAWAPVYARDSGGNYLAPFDKPTCAIPPGTTCYMNKHKYNGTGEWQRVEFSFITPSATDRLDLYIRVQTTPGTAYFDAIKIERGGTATAYSDYREAGLIYQKLAPSYLGCPTADECSQFVNYCSAFDVGCDWFTSVTTKYSVPAKVTAYDYCPAECVGYDTYVQQGTLYDSLRNSYFIPQTAQGCSAATVGCDEFTNLDEVARGGEGREYYSYLRQCIKPSVAACADYYTWEGSAETGYQLRAYVLQLGAGGEPDVTDPVADAAGCSPAIYAYPETDPLYNPDCREIYDSSANISYHLYSLTIACSDDCHPYRRTENNIEANISTQAACQAFHDGLYVPPGITTCNLPASTGNPVCWDAANSNCMHCKNRGRWDATHQACLYDAIPPPESIACGAGQAGCREYTGNAGANMRIVLNDDFEDGTLQGWFGELGDTENISNESLTVGGHSFTTNDVNSNNIAWTSKKIGQIVEQDKSYFLSFIAKPNGADNYDKIHITTDFCKDVTGKILGCCPAGITPGIACPAIGGTCQRDSSYFVNDTVDPPILLKTGWHYYKANLANLNEDVCDNTALRMRANDTDGAGRANLWLDDIRLTEVTDRYYLIKNSWNTPDACLNDIAGNYVGPYYNLGCDHYKDSENLDYYLHSFSRLCSEAVVGCELMIDTYNSASYDEAWFNDANGDNVCDVLTESDCVEVLADEAVYVVYDRAKQCFNRDKGCQRLGNPNQYLDQAVYNDVYLKNDPDQYSNILCQDNATRCNQWSSNDGISYFKDPQGMVCEWRQAVGLTTGSWAWYKTRIKRCDDGSAVGSTANNGRIDVSGSDPTDFAPLEVNICNTNNDCNIGNCILDTNDYKCPSDPFKTFGKGGPGNVIEQPTSETVLIAANNVIFYWAGLCPVNEAGCTEYIDPMSQFSTNIVYNSDFSQDVDNDSVADGWANLAGVGRQTIDLQSNTLYVLTVDVDAAAAIPSNTISINVPLNSAEAEPTFANDLINELINGSNVLSADTDQLSISVSPSEKASLRFYTRDLASRNNKIVIQASQWASNNGTTIKLRKAVVDYQLKQEVDQTSCNGMVKFDDGCVLFNERTQNGFGKASLSYDADNTAADTTPNSISCVGASCELHTNTACPGGDSDCAIFHNANTLLKVRPDRTCNKWLACRSIVAIQNEAGEEQNVCFDIGLCDSVDKNGNCDSFIITDQINQTYPPPPVTVDLLSNMSGYVKVGYQECDPNSGNCITSSEYTADFPLAAMKQAGEVAVIPNGDFEIADSSGYPMGWRYGNAVWNNNYFVVIDNPYSAQEEGIGYAPVGRNFMKLGSTYYATSEVIDVEPDVEYILTAFINTINLADGIASVRIKQYGPGGGATPIQVNNDVISLGSGNEWTYRLGSFLTLPGAASIEVELNSSSIAVGNFYFDDVKLRPALESKKLPDGSYWYTPQTCRLYPEDDSLSCDYFDDSGIRQRGSLGYCLQYDRYPGSSDTCILWWPVDKVKGEGIEEGAGYNNRMPLFYALAVASNSIQNNEGRFEDASQCNQYLGCNGGDCGQLWCDHRGCCIPRGRNAVQTFSERIYLHNGGDIRFSYDNRNGWSNTDIYIGQTSNGPWEYVGTTMSCTGPYGPGSCNPILISFPPTSMEWFQYVLFQNIDAQLLRWPWHRGGAYGPSYVSGSGSPYVSRLVQVVTSMGQNKYWSGRVYQGSNYVSNSGYGYSASTPPFGALPNYSINPANWGQLLASGVSIHTSGSVARMFARSYGYWSWNGSGYIKTAGDWVPPSNLCTGADNNGDGIPDRPNSTTLDWCGVPPRVWNLEVNNKSSTDVVVGKNQFVNLTFNTDVDDNQLPMVMYSVNWGDYEDTVVTGVEMRDRPNIDDPATPEDEGNPHSLFHLYSYWDLKAKYSVDQGSPAQNTVYCADAGQVTVNWNGNNNPDGISCSGSEACCVVKPSVKIKDNWGWCNNIVPTPPATPQCANYYEPFAHWIIVKSAFGISPCVPSLNALAVLGSCNLDCPQGCRGNQDLDCQANGCCGDFQCLGNEMNPNCASLDLVADPGGNTYTDGGPGCGNICGNNLIGTTPAPGVSDCDLTCTTNGACDGVCPARLSDGAGCVLGYPGPNTDPDCDRENSLGGLIIPCCGDGFCDPGEPGTCIDCGGSCVPDGCNNICPFGCAPTSADPDCNTGCCGDFNIDPDGIDNIINGVPPAGDDEECDDGADGVDTNQCYDNCTFTFCGDTITQNLNGLGVNEQCDDGADGNDFNQCYDNCTITYCGDTITQPLNGQGIAEVCDDGNTVQDCVCLADCSIPYCGDGVVCGAEVCDDGNNIDGDGCAADCSGP